MQTNASLTGKLNTLTVKQEQLIALLLAGVHINAAAKQLKINEVTAHRWLKLPAFQQAMQKARQAVFSSAIDELKGGLSDAISALRRNMKEDVTIPPQVQVRAAQVVLENALALYKKDMPETEQHTASGLPAELLQHATLEELSAFENLVKTIEERKRAEEEKAAGIKPLR